jgi:hypothetical protein
MFAVLVCLLIDYRITSRTVDCLHQDSVYKNVTRLTPDILLELQPALLL